MKSPVFKFKVKLDVFKGKADWHFAYLPINGSRVINEMFSDMKRGWNSLPVNVCIGITKWNTSIFYMKGEKRFMLPLKKEIRKKEGISTGDKFEVEIGVVV